ncbi:Acetyl-CoA biotin carboxyl carrier [Planctomycetes bacterium Pla163]|uniref:Biotin carboxyl carrier protein of acetyl-CoA carboxylase n=1 Tax=Rohdeia mirabilis TaxID=2528008 RepID=A0A518D0A5_9BACT|nr:Acetyl-CoA biotin carboxyl carrier [Planctomycetes bacterium Pla163]
MEIKLVHALVRIMKRAELTELEIDDANAGLRVHLKRGGSGDSGSPLVNVLQGGGMGGPMMGGPSMGGHGMGGHGQGQGDAGTGAAAGSAGPAPLPPGTFHFTSPMVGTFYRSSSPDSAPFVDVGTVIDEDSTLCIVEAMKVMNEIKAEVNGKIVEVLVENAEPVEFGQPLFLVAKN